MRTPNPDSSPKKGQRKRTEFIPEELTRTVKLDRFGFADQIKPTDFSRSNSREKLSSIEAKMQTLETKLKITEAKNTKLEFEIYKLKERQAVLEKFIDEEVTEIVGKAKEERDYWRERALMLSGHRTKN